LKHITNVKKQIGTLGGEEEKETDLTVITITINYNFDITTNDNKI
jgi:hypothetical protein